MVTQLTPRENLRLFSCVMRVQELDNQLLGPNSKMLTPTFLSGIQHTLVQNRLLSVLLQIHRPRQNMIYQGAFSY